MAERTAPPSVDLPALKRRPGRTGAWLSSLAAVSADQERRAVASIEELGYGTLWFGETPTGKEALTHAALLLSASRRLMIATGIASIYGRDATAAAAGASTLSEAWQGRFVLGLGVSHLPLVSGRGHQYGKPVSTMRAYLDAMDATPYDAPVPEPVPRVLAALRPKMLELAATRTQEPTPTSSRRNTPAGPGRPSVRIHSSPPSRPWLSTPTRRGREPPPAGTRRPTSPCPTT